MTTALSAIAPTAELYLFGSRTDDTARGGDIDLLVVDDHLRPRDLRPLRLAFYERFGEQKVDIVLSKHVPDDPFVRMILPQAVRLRSPTNSDRIFLDSFLSI